MIQSSSTRFSRLLLKYTFSFIKLGLTVTRAEIENSGRDFGPSGQEEDSDDMLPGHSKPKTRKKYRKQNDISLQNTTPAAERPESFSKRNKQLLEDKDQEVAGVAKRRRD